MHIEEQEKIDQGRGKEIDNRGGKGQSGGTNGRKILEEAQHIVMWLTKRVTTYIVVYYFDLLYLTSCIFRLMRETAINLTYKMIIMISAR